MTVEKEREINSILEPQLQSGFKQFWKLYLNLCSSKCLNSRMSCVISLISLRLQQLQKLFGLCLINLGILFLKMQAIFSITLGKQMSNNYVPLF